jgi:hypothetical protein
LKETIRTTPLVDGLSDDVHDSTETSGTDGNSDGSSGVDDLGASDLSIREAGKSEKEQVG